MSRDVSSGFWLHLVDSVKFNYKVLLQTKIVQDVKDKQSPVVPIRFHRHVDIICVWAFLRYLGF